MGCRYVAFITLALFIVLDLLTISAVSSGYSQSEIDVDADLPVHYKELKDAETYEESVQSYDSHIIMSDTVDARGGNRNPSNQDLFYYRSPAGSRVQVRFDSFELSDPRLNYISAYAGSPLPNWLERYGNDRTTAVSGPDFSSHIRTLPYVFSSRMPQGGQEYRSNGMLGKVFTSDSNELLLKFTHRGKQLNIPEDRSALHFEVSFTNEAYDSEGVRIVRDSLDQKLPDAESFRVCEASGDEEYQSESSHTANSGTITSHPQYGNDDGVILPDKRCVANLSSKNHGNIKISVNSLHVADTLVDNEENCKNGDDGHIVIRDLTSIKDGVVEETVWCVNSVIGNDYEFGPSIQIIYNTGAWVTSSTAGFELVYTAIKDSVTKEDETDEELEDSADALSDSSGTAVPTIEKLEEEPVEEEVNTQPSGIMEPTDKPEEVRVARAQTDGSGMPKYKMPRMFFIIILATGVVMILLIIIAGVTAWHRTQQQDELISSLTEKLTSLESQYPQSGSSESAIVDIDDTQRRLLKEEPDRVCIVIPGDR